MKVNIGKYYYASNSNVSDKLVRLMDVKEKEVEETICIVKPVPFHASPDYAYTAKELVNNYTAIEPQLVSYYVVFKDAPIEDSIYLVIEPYSVEESLNKDSLGQAVAINLHKTYSEMGYEVGITTFNHQKHMDSLAFFEDMWGYKNAEVGPIWHSYYSDDSTVLVYRTLQDLLFSNKSVWTSFRTKDLADFSDDAVRTIASNTWYRAARQAMDFLLNLKPMQTKYIDTITVFIKTHVITDEVREALVEVLKLYNQAPVSMQDVEDLVFQNSILVLPYNFEMDLHKIKNDNSLYNMVLVRSEESKVYVILYRQQPVEFRNETQTGFSDQEMAKLLG